MRFLLLLLLVPLSLMANCWEALGRLHYWKPCAGTFDVKSDYEVGYTVALGIVAPQSNTFITSGYTRYKATFAKGDLHRRFEYHAGNVRVGVGLPRCQGNISAYLGMRAFDLRERRVDSNKVEAGGVEFGIMGEQPFGCLNLVAEIGAFLGVGEQETTLLTSQTACITSVDGRLGASYLSTSSSYNMRVEVGYDFLHYNDVLRRRLLGGDVTCYSVGFIGPYGAVKLRF